MNISFARLVEGVNSDSEAKHSTYIITQLALVITTQILLLLCLNVFWKCLFGFWNFFFYLFKFFAQSERIRDEFDVGEPAMYASLAFYQQLRSVSALSPLFELFDLVAARYYYMGLVQTKTLNVFLLV